MMPSSRASTNVPIASPANSSSVSSVITTVRLVVIDRPSVCRIEWLTIRSNGSPTWRARFSRTRSNTTIVSWTEKPMTVSIAVTNRPSIWSPAKVPRNANTPTTTSTSWSSEISAVVPIRTSRKRYVIQSRIPIDPTRISTRACVMRSLDTTAPTDDSDCCSAIGPRAASRATRASPSLPWVGSTPPDPAPALGLGAALAPGEAEADPEGAGLPVGEAEGAVDAEADGDAAGEPEAPADAEADGPAEADAAGDPDGPAEAPGLAEGAGVGAGASAASFVRISMNPWPVWVTLASIPCPDSTSRTWSGLTFGSSNRIVHTVPPVKSIANWS